MKPILVSILLIFPLVVSGSETLSPKNLVGVWVDSKPFSIKGKLIKWLANVDSYRLTISKDFDVIFQRIFDSGTEHRIEVNRSKLIFCEELYIINLPQQSGGKYQLVLAGWESHSSKSLFGYLYLYNMVGFFNGWPLAFMPEEENSPTGR